MATAAIDWGPNAIEIQQRKQREGVKIKCSEH